MVLARELDTVVHGVDVHEPFLTELSRRAADAQLGHRVQTACMDMADIPTRFSSIDLLWSEGAAYNIGFSNALTTRARAIERGGFAVVSELCWLTERPPEAVRAFFEQGYPDMQSIQDNITVAERAGYEVVAQHTLPAAAWVDDYYEILGPRASALTDHTDPSVRDFALETLEEIEIFRAFSGQLWLRLLPASTRLSPRAPVYGLSSA